MTNLNADACVHCGLCTKHCLFLKNTTLLEVFFSIFMLMNEILRKSNYYSANVQLLLT